MTHQVTLFKTLVLSLNLYESCFKHKNYYEIASPARIQVTLVMSYFMAHGL